MKQTLKNTIEKPSLILILILVAYFSLFFTKFRENPIAEVESHAEKIVVDFSEAGFFPKIGLVRNLPDWGHVGYYVIAGRVAKAAKFAENGDETRQVQILRLFSLIFMALAMMKFVRLGDHYLSHNRLNPMWVSFGLLVFALNPYTFVSAFEVGHMSLLLFLMFAALYYFEQEDVKNASVFLCTAVLVDWRAMLLAIVFVYIRASSDSSKLIRPDRIFALAAPFLIALLPIVAWRDIVPQGEVGELWNKIKTEVPLLKIDGLFYAFAIFPIYTLFYSWNLTTRSRVRSTTIALILAALFIPLYFIFPIEFDQWNKFKYSMEIPLGLIDKGAMMVAGPYKNVLLLLPFLYGAFLFWQIFLRDILDETRALKAFIILFFISEMFTAGLGGALSGGISASVGDHGFLIVVPFIILFALSEALVGEEGKLI